MKRIIAAILFFLVVSNCLSQEIEPSGLPTSADYLKKSRGQKFAGSALLGVGIGSIIFGKRMADGQNAGNLDDSISEGLGGLAMMGMGAVTTALGVACFIGAAKNKRRASSVSANLSIEDVRVVMPRANFAVKRYPALSIAINL